MKLRTFVAFAFITNMAVSLAIIACVFFALSFMPQLATSILNHGAFALTMLLLISAHPTKIMDKRRLLSNKAWYRRLAAMLFSSFSGFVAVASFYLALQSLGYEFQAPKTTNIDSLLAFNVAWFFVMVAIVELCSKFTDAAFIQDKAQ